MFPRLFLVLLLASSSVACTVNQCERAGAAPLPVSDPPPIAIASRPLELKLSTYIGGGCGVAPPPLNLRTKVFDPENAPVEHDAEAQTSLSGLATATIRFVPRVAGAYQVIAELTSSTAPVQAEVVVAELRAATPVQERPLATQTCSEMFLTARGTVLCANGLYLLATAVGQPWKSLGQASYVSVAGDHVWIYSGGTLEHWLDSEAGLARVEPPFAEVAHSLLAFDGEVLLWRYGEVVRVTPSNGALKVSGSLVFSTLQNEVFSISADRKRVLAVGLTEICQASFATPGNTCLTRGGAAVGSDRNGIWFESPPPGLGGAVTLAGGTLELAVPGESGPQIASVTRLPVGWTAAGSAQARFLPGRAPLARPAQEYAISPAKGASVLTLEGRKGPAHWVTYDSQRDVHSAYEQFAVLSGDRFLLIPR